MLQLILCIQIRLSSWNRILSLEALVTQWVKGLPASWQSGLKSRYCENLFIYKQDSAVHLFQSLPVCSLHVTEIGR